MLKQHKKILLTAQRRQVGIVDIPYLLQGDNILYDALLVYKVLNVKTVFQNWIKRRIDEFGFKEGEDYFPNLEIVKGSKKPVTKYLITSDMAKELAMLERNEIGRAIRKYFIAKEKEARGMSLLPREGSLFKGLKPRRINGRLMYPYKEILRRCGYSTRSSSSQRRARYWMHFVLDGQLLYITEEFAMHLYHSKQVQANRAAMLAAKPVIPSLFGDTALLQLPPKTPQP